MAHALLETKEYVQPKTFEGPNNIKSRIVYNHPNATIITKDHERTVKRRPGEALS